MENVGLALGFAAACLFSIGIVLTTKWHGKFTLDGTSGIQKFHIVPTPRIGGVAVMAGLVTACIFSSDEVSELLTLLAFAGLPAFVFGVAEDLTKRVSVRARLFATMASGLLAWVLTDASVNHLGVPQVDRLLSLLPISVLFTAFAVGGVANSVNIIDGFNGLASGTVALCLGALGLISHQCGDVVLASVCFLVMAVTLGFFAVNFPFGKLFLGDGGAYLLGFLLAWLAVMLPYRNPSVSVWAPLLACAYPVFETVFTIMRRLWTRRDPGQPDNDHLHSLVKVSISRRLFPTLRADLRNASVSPVVWSIAVVPAALSVRYAQHTGALVLSSLVSFALYLCVYWYVCTVSRASRKPTATVIPFVDLADEEVFPARRVS